MDERRVVSEPAAGTEADLSTGTKSTLQPLQYETGEFDRLVSDAPLIEDVGLGSPEELLEHMHALVGDEEQVEARQEQEVGEPDGGDEDDVAPPRRSIFRSGERGLFRRTGT